MVKALSELSKGLAEVVHNAGPSIVRVDARRHVPATGIVWSADGLIVTANHVLRRDDSINIGLDNGQTTTATVVGRDPTTDLALLRVSGDAFVTFQPAAETEMSPGHLALALGRPGQSVQATLGIVSALGSAWRTRMGGQIDHYLQTDVVMYPGFSGGPLLSVDGQLLGLNTSGLGQGVSLAIPVMTVGRVVDMLNTHGRIRRGYLGVNTQRVRLPENLRTEVGQKSGLLIVSVETQSPAEAAGMTLGDTIISLSGKAITNHEDLLAALTGDVVGQKEVVRIIRGGQIQELTARIGERA